MRRLIARYLNPVVEFIYRIKFKFISFRHTPIIILTPGKVGSSSIYETLKAELENPVFHIHRLSEEGVKQSVMEHLNSDRQSRPLHLIVSKLLREKLKAYDGDLYIITSIREPVSRAVSAFFQNTDFYKSEVEKEGMNIDQDKAKKLLSEQVNSGISDQLENWFEEEILQNFRIDVFEKAFDENKGFRINQKEHCRHLLIKMEDLNEQFPKAIQELLNLERPIELRKANIGSKKFYANAYKSVKNSLEIDKDEINEIVDSNYFQHFYKSQADTVKEKWSQG